MAATIAFFPVGNGDMTLITLESGHTILIDVNIRVDADNPEKDTPDVAKNLRSRLKRNAKGRLYVDVFLLSHPDKDHCSGLERHFHLGPPADWVKTDDKIFIREVWSSPMVFRRASRSHVLCSAAAAFNCEARRRVARFREVGAAVDEGDRILILGEDENGKTDDLTEILVKVDEEFTRVSGESDPTMTARLLAPQPRNDDESVEESRAKNRSSTIINFSLKGGGVADAGRFLTGGDAEVAIWERLWERHHERPDWLRYDILQTPHHCSWHSLSHDSWSKMGEKARMCAAARSALSQTRKGAVIVASSEAISDDDRDPPCVRAKREYEVITKEAGGSFLCVGEPADNPEMIEFEIGKDGPRRKTRPMKAPAIIGSGAIGGQPLAHG